MNYHFFDYKYNIPDFGSDLFSIPHLVFIGLAFVCVPLICFLVRKAKHKGIDVFLKVFSILILVLELAKIAWESYYDITTGRGFNKEGILPLYTCSLLIYTLFGAAWGKGKVKEYSLAYLATINLLSGAIGIVYCRGLNYYPFWTFGAFYSLFFHLSMFTIGVLIIMTKFKKLEWKDIVRAWFPLAILSFISTPVNYAYGADYMQTYSASGVPLLSDFASILAAHNIRYIFTVFMLFLYIPMAAIVVCFVKPWYLIGVKKKVAPAPEGGQSAPQDEAQEPVQEESASEQEVKQEAEKAQKPVKPKQKGRPKKQEATEKVQPQKEKSQRGKYKRG